MTTMETDRLIDDYLDRLERAAAHLQRARRAELVAEIREHIEVALREEDAAGEAVVRNVLERLGEPEEIVEAAEPLPPGGRAGKLEIGALILMVVPFIGWLFGIVLVLLSSAWSNRQKLIGIGLALLPVLIPLLTITAGSNEGSDVSRVPTDPQPTGLPDTGGNNPGLGPFEVVVLVFGFLAGLPSVLYLSWQLRRNRPADA
jgi:hypothetical protein